MTDIRVESLHSYPIKSCAPIELESIGVEPEGLQYDREWVVVRQVTSGLKFLSQREAAELARVQTDIAEGALHISAAEFGEIKIPLDRTEMADKPTSNIEIFEKVGTGRDQGDEAAEFFGDFLQANHRRGVRNPVRLMRIEQPRRINPKHHTDGMGDSIKFADGAPILLTSSASLAELNEVSTEHLAMSRFRPNIVVGSEYLVPYDEDYWRTLVIGGLNVAVKWACARCPMPNVDQEIGVLPKPAERAATLALKASRLGLAPGKEEPAVFFGENLTHTYEPGMTVSVGDKIIVNESVTERNFTPLV